MNKALLVSVIIGLLGVALLGGYYLGSHNIDPTSYRADLNSKATTQLPQPLIETNNQANDAPRATSTTAKTKSTINLKKLPLGDNKISTTAKQGYIYSCIKQTESQGGAGVDGPWIDKTNLTWDFTQKVTVDGAVMWKNAKWSISENGSTRILTGNGLPSHKTGVYPIAASDDAYKYDRNPNSIKEQTLTVTLSANPTQLQTPECVGGEVGIMLTGIPLFNGFDAGSRDAAAHEIQDDCAGHPQVSGQYHYHGPSPCLKDNTATTEHSALVGYAFDGFGIYGLKGEGGVELSTDDLDACHGHTHEIEWDGKKVTMYHYHLTHDFPYSVGCFRGKKSVTGPLGGKSEQGMGQPPQSGSQSNRPRPSGPPPGGNPPPMM